MFEKVNPSHPDKIADRIAGAIVDIAYKNNENPHIAVEVLIGHGECFIIIESDVTITNDDIEKTVKRISGIEHTIIKYVNQDAKLNANQLGEPKCGDNGIFNGIKTSLEEQKLTDIVGTIYNHCPYDGKYIINDDTITACQSNIDNSHFMNIVKNFDYKWILNPLGPWTGGLHADSGATNRKLGSDMGRAVTGGGLHGKDLSKADVTLNIIAYLMAQDKGYIEFQCNIGDVKINNVSYNKYIEIAREYIKHIGGFEKFAEWGLIRPFISDNKYFITHDLLNASSI